MSSPRPQEISEIWNSFYFLLENFEIIASLGITDENRVLFWANQNFKWGFCVFEISTRGTIRPNEIDDEHLSPQNPIDCNFYGLWIRCWPYWRISRDEKPLVCTSTSFHLLFLQKRFQGCLSRGLKSLCEDFMTWTDSPYFIKWLRLNLSL